ncbi:MAG: response regulator [bacterium]|nr:response regulator [bacterium]
MTENTTNDSTDDKPLILLVDDVPENIQVLYQILNNGDYSFAIASGGNEALQLVEKKLPDLILLDVMMGDIDGFEVCRELKKDAPKSDIPIIFLTAKVDVEDKVRGFKLGAVDYITKPFEDAEVLARVQTHVRLKQSMDIIKDCNMQLTEHLGEMLFSFQELKNSQEKLSHVENQKDFKSLTIHATHEINQPLTVLVGYLDLLKETIDPVCITSAQQKYMERMESALKKLMITIETFRKCTVSIGN